MSKQPVKAAHSVPAFFKKRGFNIIPINPTVEQIIKLKTYSGLDDIPDTIDILNVFRPSDEVPGILEEAIERKKQRGDIKLIWLQSGITCPNGKDIANSYNIDYIEDKCIYMEYVNLGL